MERPPLKLVLPAIVCLALTFASSAWATTVILGPDPPTSNQGRVGCTSNAACTQTFAQLAIPPTGGVRLSPPADGVIVQWRVNGTVSSGAYLALRVLRPGPGGTFTGLATGPPITELTTSSGAPPNSVNIPIQLGDVIGVDSILPGPSSGLVAQIAYSQPLGATTGVWDGGLADGVTAFPSSQSSNERLQLNATVQLSAPVVTNVSPQSGTQAGGQSVTIDGQHLANASQVLFGSNAAAITANSNSQIVATAPPGTPGPVDVTVATVGGTSAATAADRYTYDGPPPPADRTPPALSSFLLAPSTFKAANFGPSVQPAAAVGTHVVYRASETASTAFTVERRTSGVRKGRRCLPGRARAGRRGCIRYVRVKGSFSYADAQGLNTFRFMGRIRGHALRPGRYRLVAVTRDVAGNTSGPARRPFRIRN